MIKKSNTIISIILLSFNLFHAGESFYRDYTASTDRIIFTQNQEDVPFYKKPFVSDGYFFNKDLCNNVLVSLGSNNKLFTCYSGYKKVDHWTKSGGNYRDEPIIKQTTNILTETDTYTKVEYKFDDLPEICNEHPVNDIARWKNNYYVAYANDVYIYQANNPWITSLKLSRTHHLSSNAAGDIKKIFIDQDDNVIAVSSFGTILKSNSAQSSPERQTLSLISQSFPRDEKVYSMAYNARNNMMLLGGHNFVHIVPLNDTSKVLHIPFDQLRINTIDTNDDYVLLSDVDPHCDRYRIKCLKGHLEKENCCIEKQTPYEQWKECQDCINAQDKWQKDKEAWENEIVTVSETISRKDILDKAQEQSTYKIPQLAKCEHRTPPIDMKTLIGSCRRNTILLLSLSKLLSAAHDDEADRINLTPSIFIKKRIDYSHKKETALLTHTFLTNDFLFIGQHKGEDRNPYLDFIYKIPLKDMQSTDINGLFISNKWAHPQPKELLYYSDEQDDPYSFNKDCNYRQPLLVHKTTEPTERVVIVKTSIPCSKDVQGGCFNKEHWLQRIYDVILFTKKDDVSHQINKNTRILSRYLHVFKNTAFSFGKTCVSFSMATITCGAMTIASLIITKMIRDNEFRKEFLDIFYQNFTT